MLKNTERKFTPVSYLRYQSSRKVESDCLKRASSLAEWKHNRTLRRLGRTKPHRTCVGIIRAFGAMHFFHGAYAGADRD